MQISHENGVRLQDFAVGKNVVCLESRNYARISDESLDSAVEAILKQSISVQNRPDKFQFTKAFPYENDSRLYLKLNGRKVDGIAKVLKTKMLFRRDNFGYMKGIETTALIDFFVAPDNDLLNETSGAKKFFDQVLATEGRSAA